APRRGRARSARRVLRRRPHAQHPRSLPRSRTAQGRLLRPRRETTHLIRTRLDYGWVVVAGLCVTETVSWGILYHGFPLFLGPMEAELGWSRVQITGAFSLGLLSSALAALPVGRFIDRHGARGLMTAGSCMASLLVLAWSRIDSLPALYALWLLMGLA